MFKLEVLVKPVVLEEVIAELIAIGVRSLSYSEIHTADREFHPDTSTENLAEAATFSPVMKVELILEKGNLNAIEKALAKKVSAPLIGGAEVTVIKLKDSLHILGGSDRYRDVEVI